MTRRKKENQNSKGKNQWKREGRMGLQLPPAEQVGTEDKGPERGKEKTKKKKYLKWEKGLGE